MSTRKRDPLIGLTAIASAVLIGACGSSGAAGTAAGSGSAGGTAGAAATSSTSIAATTTARATSETKREKAVRFAECMRTHGVPHFPDPDPSGNFNFGVDVSATVFTTAVNACKRLQPPGSLSGKRSPLQQTAALRFAQCVRAHGVTDFPDPVNGQPLINTYQIPSSNTPSGMNILNAASHACGAMLGSAAGGRR